MSELLTELPSALLLERVRELVSGLNVVEADLLAHLGEVDARRLYLEQGCSDVRLVSAGAAFRGERGL